jgi:hypothetical protein
LANPIQIKLKELHLKANPKLLKLKKLHMKIYPDQILKTKCKNKISKAKKKRNTILQLGEKFKSK